MNNATDQGLENALIYNASNGSNVELGSRDYRYERRAKARIVSGHERFKKCGRTSYGAVTIGVKNGHAQQRGLYTCGSVWVCSVCSAKILTSRAIEIEQALSAWVNQGGYFVFQTLTLSHRPGDSVAKQRSVASNAWKAINKGSFTANNKKNGQKGYFRVTEINNGENGPHLHFHVMRFVERWLPKDELDDWMSKVFEKWADAVQAQGMRRPKEEGHNYQQVTCVEDWGGYFTKNFDNPREAVLAAGLGQNKVGTMWDVLTEAISEPKSKAAQTWRAYERDTKNLNQITWSRDIRKSLGLGVEISDEDLASEEGVFIPLIQIFPEDVPKLGRLGWLHSRVLHHIEKGDLEVAFQILNEHDISFYLYPQPQMPGV
jgi:hypothetical protein